MLRSTRWSRTFALAAGLALAGCGGPGSFNGTVGGLSLAVKDSIFLATRNSGQVAGLTLLMTDQAGICEALKGGKLIHNGTYFFAVLGESSGSQLTAPTAGEYAVVTNSPPASRFFLGGLTKTDATCQSTNSVQAVGGTVTLSGYKAEAGGSMTGKFDLTFGQTAERGTGDFDADFCDASISGGGGGCQ